MAAITLLDIQDVCTDITRVAAVWLQWVNTKLSVDSFDGEDGLTTKLIRIYLAAHFETINVLGGTAGGALQSASEGGISRSYAVAVTDLSSSALARTAYGKTASGIMRLYVTGAGIASADG